MKFVCLLMLILLVEYSKAGGNLILPHGMDQETYCKGCMNTVIEMTKEFEKYKDMKKVVKRMEKICPRLKNDDRKTCEHFIVDHSEYLEDLAENPPQIEHLKARFCHEKTFACLGIKTMKQDVHDLTDEALDKVVQNIKAKRIVPNPIRQMDEL